jgi:hypothetical protein
MIFMVTQVFEKLTNAPYRSHGLADSPLVMIFMYRYKPERIGSKSVGFTGSHAKSAKQRTKLKRKNAKIKIAVLNT